MLVNKNIITLPKQNNFVTSKMNILPGNSIMKSPVPNHANKDIGFSMIRPKKNQKMFKKSSNIYLSQVRIYGHEVVWSMATNKIQGLPTLFINKRFVLNKMLHNLIYFMYKKTLVICFVFQFMQLLIFPL